MLWFWKKGPDCVYLRFKFSIQNVVSRVSGRKNSKMFPFGTFFWRNICGSAPVPRISPILKISGCAATTQALFFMQDVRSKMCECEYASVSIDAQYFVQWPYAMTCIRHNMQNSGIFRILFIQVYSGIFKHIQHY